MKAMGESVNLSRMQLQDEVLVHALRNIPNPNHVKELNLAGNSQISVWPQVKFPALETLDLSECAHYANAVANTLAHCQGLTTLILQCCCIQSLPSCISNCASTLKLLNLRGNALTRLPQAAVQMKHLEELNLSGNKLDDLSVKPVCSLISFRLACLHLANNRIGASGAVALAKSLSNGSALQILVLSGNRGVGDNGVAAIFDAMVTGIHSTTELHTLRLDACNIGDMSARAILAAIRTDSALQILSMGRNRLGDETLISLSRTLEDKQGLCRISELDLSDNLLRADGAMAMAATILHNNTLLRLNLAGNDSLIATSRATLALADSIARNKALLDINLSRCKMGSFQAKTLLAAVGQNKELDDIHCGFDHSKQTLFSCKIKERLRPAARLRTDIILKRILSRRIRSHLSPTDLAESSKHNDHNSVVSVSYGRRPNVIGSIRCFKSTSLADARIDLEDRFDLKEYVMMAADGKRSFSLNEEDKRHVIEDCGTSLQLRPLTWISL